MFFVPSDDEGKWSENQRGSPVLSITGDVEPVTTCFIVVPKWSDGTRYPYPGPGQADARHHH